MKYTDDLSDVKYVVHELDDSLSASAIFKEAVSAVVETISVLEQAGLIDIIKLRVRRPACLVRAAEVIDRITTTEKTFVLIQFRQWSL